MAGISIPMMVPSTPSIAITDINVLYQINVNDLKGTGAFSRVVTAVNRRNGAPRALKVMDRAGLTGKKAAMVLHEKEILRRTNHPSIIRLHQFIQTPTQVFFELDLMQTDLFEFIMIHKRINEDDTALIMTQLLSAVAYLHETDIIHRDIKPENILINSPSDIKLADFGLAKVVDGAAVRNTPCGTSYYIAPEVIRSIELQGATPLTTTREDVKAVDIWACGVTMFVLLAGRPPFNGQVKTSDDRRTLLRRIDRGVLFHEDRWNTISEDAKDLVMRLLSQEINSRITAAEALRHPFFTHRNLRRIPAVTDLPIPAAPVSVTGMMADTEGPQPTNTSPADENGNTVNEQSKSENAATLTKPKHQTDEEEEIREELAAMMTDLLAAGDEQMDHTEYKSLASVVEAVHTASSVTQKKTKLPGMKK